VELQIDVPIPKHVEIETCIAIKKVRYMLESIERPTKKKNLKSKSKG
jgi:hypothetical protein